MNLGLIDVEGGDALQFIFHGWEGAMDKAAHAQKCAGCFAENGGKGKVVMKFWLPAAAFRWPPQLSCGKGGW